MNVPPVQYVTTSDGYDIAYTVCGEGRPLILGPGPVHSLNWMWRRPYFPPGFGATSRTLHTCSV